MTWLTLQKRIIKVYCEILYANALKNVFEMNQFLDSIIKQRWLNKSSLFKYDYIKPTYSLIEDLPILKIADPDSYMIIYKKFSMIQKEIIVPQ